MWGLTTKTFLHFGHVTSTAWPIAYLTVIFDFGLSIYKAAAVLSSSTMSRASNIILKTDRFLRPVSGPVDWNVLQHFAGNVLFQLDALHRLIGTFGNRREWPIQRSRRINDHS
jgi:hypothetical protein